jgi:hypothetical protein
MPWSVSGANPMISTKRSPDMVILSDMMQLSAGYLSEILHMLLHLFFFAYIQIYLFSGEYDVII